MSASALAQEAVTPRPSGPGLAVLVAISALHPFTMNMLAPVMPTLSVAFGVSYATVQLSLTLYLVAVALTQVVAGPVSDRVGRRPVLLWSIAAYVLGSLLAPTASGVVPFLTARVLQAIGAGTTFALARAVVRDTSERDEAASRLGYISAVMVLVPMFAPLLGGRISLDFGWRAIFWLNAVLGAGLSVFMLAALGETNLSQVRPVERVRLFTSLPVLLSSRSFTIHAAVMCLASGTMFTFISAAPYLVENVMGRTPDLYGLFAVCNAAGFMVGTFLAGRLSRRLGGERLILAGTLVSLFGLLVALAATSAFPMSLWALFLPQLLVTGGNGMTLPNATAGALSARQNMAGAAAGVAGALQIGSGAIFSVVASVAVMHWPPSMLLLMTAYAACSTALVRLTRPSDEGAVPPVLTPSRVRGS